MICHCSYATSAPKVEATSRLPYGYRVHHKIQDKPTMSDVLIVGASRGLGDSLVKKYALGTKGTVFATSRSESASKTGKNVKSIPGIDLCSESAGSKLASQLAQFGASLATVIITAGYFGTETFDEPKWEDEIKMQVFQNMTAEQLLYTVLAIHGYPADGNDFSLL